MADLKVSNLYKRLGHVEVLRDINLDIKSGEFVVFVGLREVDAAALHFGP